MRVFKTLRRIFRKPSEEPASTTPEINSLAIPASVPEDDLGTTGAFELQE